jgi:hypothetical protein
VTTAPPDTRVGGRAPLSDDGPGDPDALRTENRRLLAKVHHLEVELKDAQEHVAFLAQELVRVRQTIPRGTSTA